MHDSKKPSKPGRISLLLGRFTRSAAFKTFVTLSVIGVVGYSAAAVGKSLYNHADLDFHIETIYYDIQEDASAGLAYMTIEIKSPDGIINWRFRRCEVENVTAEELRSGDDHRGRFRYRGKMEALVLTNIISTYPKKPEAEPEE